MTVDNCFATPCLQQPAQFGADLIVHSATKLIDGQGRVLGGAIVGSSQRIEPNYLFLRQTGGTLSAFNAWLLARSIDTLPIRVKAQSESALTLAQWLEQRNDIERVLYPGLVSHPQHQLALKQMRLGGSMICFSLPGGMEQGQKFLNSIQGLSLSANLGDTKSIITHPASTTHAKLSQEERASMGINDGLIRISVGLEHPHDIQNILSDSLDRL